MGRKEYYEETITRKGEETHKKGERRIYETRSDEKWPTKRDAFNIAVGLAAWIALQAFAGSLQ